MDHPSPLSPAQMVQTCARLGALVKQRLALHEMRVEVGMAPEKPPKGAPYAYSVTVRIDGAPPTDAQNAVITDLVRETLNDAVRWASAN